MGSFEKAMGADRENIPWLGLALAAASGRALGMSLDREHLLMAEAITVRLPVYCPADALDEVGALYKIERYAGEADAVYRARLVEAWDTWRLAGTPEAIVKSLNAYGIADVAVYRDDDGHFVDGEWYSRFWVVIGPIMPYAPLVAPFVTPATGGSTATIDDVRAVKRQILKWKAPHGYPVKVILRFPGVILGGINAIPPFIPPIGSSRPTWKIGKTQNDTITTAPFIAGGYIKD